MVGFVSQRLGCTVLETVMACFYVTRDNGYLLPGDTVKDQSGIEICSYDRPGLKSQLCHLLFLIF